jgi:hypothetical protein
MANGTALRLNILQRRSNLDGRVGFVEMVSGEGQTASPYIRANHWE